MILFKLAKSWKTELEAELLVLIRMWCCLFILWTKYSDVMKNTDIWHIYGKQQGMLSADYMLVLVLQKILSLFGSPGQNILLLCCYTERKRIMDNCIRHIICVLFLRILTVCLQLLLFLLVNFKRRLHAGTWTTACWVVYNGSVWTQIFLKWCRGGEDGLYVWTWPQTLLRRAKWSWHVISWSCLNESILDTVFHRFWMGDEVQLRTDHITFCSGSRKFSSPSSS